jgi:FAD/FMN-containing dehydrogenase
MSMEHRIREQIRAETMVQAITGATPAPRAEGGEGSEIRLHSVSELERLAQGGCWLGVDKVDITPDGVHPLAGFSLSGSRGRPGRDRLWARALYVEDIDTGQRLVVCIVDLLSGTNALLEAVERALDASGHEELVGRVIVSGTHTHAAPGRFFGNRFYDRLAAPFTLLRHDARLTRELGEKVARACIAAARQRARGDLCVLRAPVWRAARNRSLAAYRANASDPERPEIPWRTPGEGLSAEEAAVDPRVTLWCARRGDQLVGAFAWFGCHGTALGRKYSFYHRDWLGFAVDAVEAAFDGVVGAVGSGASGDVTPLPGAQPQPGAPVPPAGIELAQHVGLRVGATITEMLRALPEPQGEHLRVTLDSGVFEVAADGSTPRWQVGVPVLGGSEDGGPAYRKLQFVAEGFRGDAGAQRPKAAALGFLQALTLGPLDIAHHHPWHRVRLGDHVHCTVPGEPTVMAALTLEQRACAELGAASACVVGYTGDYCGYFTTQPEYDLQHYEGASTLYGPRSLEWYRDQLLGPSRPRPRATGAGPLPGPRATSSSGAIPMRNIQRLLSVAHELPPRGKVIDLLFAVPREAARPDPDAAEAAGRARPLPRVRLVPLEGAMGEAVEGVSRWFANPDPEGAPELETCVAVFDRARVEAAGLAMLERARLVVVHAGVERRHEIVPHERAEAAGRLPPSPPGYGPLGRVRRGLLALGLLFTLLALLLLVLPGGVLAALGWGAPANAAAPAADASFPEFMLRNVGLTFLLLGINLLVAKNSPDRRALSGYAYASSLLWLALAAFAQWAWHTELVAAIFAAVALGLGSFGFRIRPVIGRAATASHAHWEFWAPLFWFGLVTLLVGGFLLFFPAVFARWFGIRHADAEAWLRLYGAGFWVNTVSMWRAQYTRDVRVISAQLWGSIAFDGLSPVLLAIAIACQLMNPWGLLLLPPFLAFVAYMRHMQGLAYRHAHREIEKPRTSRELGRIIRDAVRDKKLVRVLGSGHSAPPAIFGDTEPQPRGRRPSRERCVHVSLDQLDRVLDIDRQRRRISVQAGLRIGVDPGHAPSSHHNLLAYLRGLGWALGDLGGIVHQTVGGFLATGSSGGSVVHGLHDGIVELRFVDAQGNVRVARRDAVGPERELFEALSVSVGLLGVVTEVTFECEAAYQVEGREFTARVSPDGVALLPAEPATAAFSGATARRLDLRAAGAEGLAAYLREPGYKRILWWPQAAISAFVIWDGRRTQVEPQKPKPYQAPQGVLQFIAGRVLELLGWSYGVGNPSIVGNWLRRKLLPPFARQFMPEKPVPFHAPWDDNLPMDTHVDEAFLPVEFTELWFDLDRTHEVMSTLLDMYCADENLAGTFTVELYAAKKCDAWLSPSHERDSFRVDIFWFQRNAGDPVIDYYPRFYSRLGPFAFRAHWGKYLPQPGSAQGADYLARQFPHWGKFLTLRRELDPKGAFLSTYWRRHLGID